MLNGWLVPEFYYSISPLGTPVLRTNVIAGSISNNLKKYELLGYVAQITSKDNTNHLVTIVKINDANDGKPENYQWYMFNDFLVTPVKEKEVFEMSHWWKRPVIVVYQESNIARQTFDYNSWQANLNDSILYRDHFAKGTREVGTSGI
ncbi:unnamed protein product [Ambrosiozyma monospora]|uniref:Unnamed protein product n=1 Tax=Ambrosiozyma monospora TaxID=43982 RepID=A0ACB5UDH0_AMBMO|nr:unnamed protein product [Ambrosiozyma monospora]